MSSSCDGIDVVVCHYNKGEAVHIRHMALHAMAFLAKDRDVDLNIIFVDGSPSIDEELAREIAALGIKYLHCGRELSFGETYNAGIRSTSNPVVVTLANDILIEAKQVRELAGEIRGKVGCALPYMSCCDYGGQEQRKLVVPRRCFPSRMTLNVNAFSREALEKVGLIPEDMSGCFNDVVLFIRLREEGWSVVLRNVGHVLHIGQQTLKTLASSVCYEADENNFAMRYPRYWRKGVVLFHKVAQRWTTRAMYRMTEWLPAALVERLNLWRYVWAVEPYVCAERGTVLEGVERVLRRPVRRRVL